MVNDSSVEVMRKISFNPIYDIFAFISTWDFLTSIRYLHQYQSTLKSLLLNRFCKNM